MKKILKRLGGRIAQALIDNYEPKIQEMDDLLLKNALMALMNWVKRFISIITDADPNDKEQIRQAGKEILSESPEVAFMLAKVAVQENKKASPELKAFIIDALTGFEEELIVSKA